MDHRVPSWPLDTRRSMRASRCATTHASVSHLGLAVATDEAALLRRLAGSPIPSITLQRINGSRIGLRTLSHGWVVFYLYPGTDKESATGIDSPAEDVAQHRAYCEREYRFRELGVRPVGISSQQHLEQLDTIREHHIEHLMLIDPDLVLAEALGLPTFELLERLWYRRLTLLAHDGVIERAFYPIATAANNPGQVLTWLQLHG
jgi:peroxiredoxin